MSNILTIDEIKVSSMGNLKVYSFDYSPPNIGSVGRSTVNFINEDNVYPVPQFNIRQPVSISVGSVMNLSMYPISHRKTCSSGLQLLEIQYVDYSFMLDKIQVGLKGVHAPFQNFSADPFIYVGKKIDPCGNEGLSTTVDPCDPCPQEERKVDCEKLRYLEIQDVDYSFKELMDSINGSWSPIKISSLPSGYNSKYRQTYSGSLRSVLQSWSADFGWSFYFDQNKIYFIDLSSGIPVDRSYISLIRNTCRVLESSESHSIEGTESRGVVASYRKQGEEKSYNCDLDYSKKLTCRPLTLKDLVAQDDPKAKVNGWGSWTLPVYDMLEICCTLSMYDPALREAFVWFNYYNIKDGDYLKDLVTNGGQSATEAEIAPYRSTLPDDDKNGVNTLNALAMTVKQVFTKDDPEFLTILGGNPSSSVVYQEAAKSIKDEAQRKEFLDGVFDNLSAEDMPYFFVASRNESAYVARITWEQSVAKDFLGKFFIRKYTDSASGKNESVSVVGAGSDNTKYYRRGQEQMEFVNLVRGMNPKSYISELFSQKQTINEATDHYILVKREPIWSPPASDSDEVRRLIDLANIIRPLELGPVTSFLNGSVNPHPELTSENNQWGAEDKLFLCIPWQGSGDKFSIATSYGTHPLEENETIETDGFTGGTRVGLASLQCRGYNINGLKIFFPPQATVREAEGSGAPLAGGYTVLIHKNRTMTDRKIVDKIEEFDSRLPSVYENTLNLSINSAAVSESDIKLYKKDFSRNRAGTVLMDQFNRPIPGCKLDKDKIKDFLREYISRLDYISDIPFEDYSFMIEGLPTINFSIQGGLKGLNIRRAGETIQTTISLGNSQHIIPSIEAFLQELQFATPKVVNKFQTSFVLPNSSGLSSVSKTI